MDRRELNMAKKPKKPDPKANKAANKNEDKRTVLLAELEGLKTLKSPRAKDIVLELLK